MAELEVFDQFLVSVARETWALFRRDPLMFIIASAVVLLGSIVSLGLVAGPLNVGFIELCRRARQGEPIALGIVFSRFDTFISSAVAFTIVGIAAFIGMFLLLLPGLLVIFFAAFTLHVITYENAGGIAAIRRSVELVRAHALHTLALLIGVSIVNALGGIVVFGLLLTSPLAILALTVGYERIRAASPQVLTL